MCFVIIMTDHISKAEASNAQSNDCNKSFYSQHITPSFQKTRTTSALCLLYLEGHSASEEGLTAYRLGSTQNDYSIFSAIIHFKIVRSSKKSLLAFCIDDHPSYSNVSIRYPSALGSGVILPE